VVLRWGASSALPPNVTSKLFDDFKASAYRYKMERSMALKIRQNAFPAGAPSWIPLGELTTLRSLLSWLGK